VSAPIFISFSSKDQEIAETIYQALEARSLDCWIAVRDVPPGENFQEAIVRALRAARVMVLVFTSNANNSDEVKKELVLAGRHRVTVVPVRVEDVVPGDAFVYEFATRQWVDLFKDWEREIERLAAQIRHILQNSKAGVNDTAQAPAVASPPLTLKPSSSRQPMILAAALLVVLSVAGAAFYLKLWATKSPAAATTAVTEMAPTQPATSALPTQTAARRPLESSPASAAPAPAAPRLSLAPPPLAVQAGPHVSAAAPEASPSPLAPPPAPAAFSAPATPTANPDDAEWQKASGAATRVAITNYLKNFSAGTHVQEAELKLAGLILGGTGTGKAFDGAWETIWTCTNVGAHPGYTFRFSGQVKAGVYHGLKGVKGQPSSMDLNGKIEADGSAAFFGEIIVGSSVVALGAARGTPSDFHALAHFEGTSGNGTRIEGRACSLSFAKE
jgi:TIR domain